MAISTQLTLPCPGVCLFEPEPRTSAITLSETSLVLGATPEIDCSGSRWGIGLSVDSSRVSTPTTNSPLGSFEVQHPAMIPATWVPWPKRSIKAVGSDLGGSPGLAGDAAAAARPSGVKSICTTGDNVSALNCGCVSLKCG